MQLNVGRWLDLMPMPSENITQLLMSPNLTFFELSPRALEYQTRVRTFMEEHIYPNEQDYFEQEAAGDRWRPRPIIEQLKPLARAAGLWNLFLPDSRNGAGLTNLEYAPLCEIMGRVSWAP